MTFYNKKVDFFYTVQDLLAVVERLLWQLGRNLVAVAVVERWHRTNRIFHMVGFQNVRIVGRDKKNAVAFTNRKEFYSINLQFVITIVVDNSHLLICIKDRFFWGVRF